jgi:hypothetical protein
MTNIPMNSMERNRIAFFLTWNLNCGSFIGGGFFQIARYEALVIGGSRSLIVICPDKKGSHYCEPFFVDRTE